MLRSRVWPFPLIGHELYAPTLTHMSPRHALIDVAPYRTHSHHASLCTSLFFYNLAMAKVWLDLLLPR